MGDLLRAFISEHTMAYFPKPGTFLTILLLYVHGEHNYYLTSEKQIDVLGAEGWYQGYSFIVLFSYVLILFFDLSFGI
jgi:hypothetical protein